MAIQYVKHDREVTTNELNTHGKFATHDIHVPILLAYELGTVPDSNGKITQVNRDFLEATMRATNNWIKKRHSSPFAKLKSFWNRELTEVEAIPIIKDHNKGNVDGTVGHTKGLLRIEEIDGIASLIVDAVIKDPEAKQKINGDIFRNTSLGTREDGSIREISFVINEAIPHGGLLMSEKDTNVKLDTSPEKKLLFAEFAELEKEFKELDEVIIPNHLVLSRLIKTGKIAPWKYDELITTRNREALQFMESSLPSVDLGIMYGTQRQPEQVDPADMLINKITSDYQSKNKPEKKAKKETITEQPLNKRTVEIINQTRSFEEQRTKELKHILELAEHSPAILEKYLKIELGEPQSADDCVSKDILLSEYIAKSKDIKTKLNQLTIELGEHA